jgi:arabinose-5-phosphate isomerase
LNKNGHSETRFQNETIEVAREVLRLEAKAVAALVERIDENFVRAIEMIFACKGRVIVTGIGKSGIIGKKIAATLSSTGTPSIFLHAGEGLHGDLGVVMKEDVMICISKSGNGGELKMLIPLFRRLGVPVVAMTGNLQSELARHADVVLDVSVEEEACPHDLAPTTSSTATLAMGDALAIALLKRRKFSPEDFALRHPGGTLGRRLLLRIDDLMGVGDKIPAVHESASLQQVILEITEKRYGATCVVSDTGALEGIITDGDLRRLLTEAAGLKNLAAKSMMCRKPKTVKKGTLAVKALEILEDYAIMQIVVVDDKNKPVGIVHLHDLLKAGVA